MNIWRLFVNAVILDSSRMPVWKMLKKANMKEAYLHKGEGGGNKYTLFVTHNNKKYKIEAWEDNFHELEIEVNEVKE